MSDTLIEQNTDELEKVLQMVNNLPEGSSSSDPHKINPDLNLLVLGDSIFGSYDGKAWVKTLGCNIQNYAVGGASLAVISEKKRADGTYNTMIDQFTRFKEGKAPLRFNEDTDKWETVGVDDWTRNFDKDELDAVLICGGGNDYLSASVLGDMTATKHLYPYVYTDASYDQSTVVGALHTLLRDIAMEHPTAQRFFLIMHRAYQCSTNTITEGKRKLWSVRQTYARVPYTRTVDGKSVTTWELLFNQNNQLLTTATEIRAATELRVRTFKDGVNNNDDEYIDYSVASDFDQNSIYSSGKHPDGTFDASKFQGRYTYEELREVIIKICNMYGFKIIDIYNESPLNVIPPQEQTLVDVVDGVQKSKWQYWDWDANNGEGSYRSIGVDNTKSLYSNPIKLANTRYFDWKGVHPTVLGYQIGYEPYVKQALCLATKK